MPRCPSATCLILSGAILLSGCTEAAFLLGTGTGLTGGVAPTVGTGSGGTVTIGGEIPISEPPDAVVGPSFAPSLLDPILEATAGAKALVAGDIDNDGVMDLASISDENQPVQIHLRNTTTNLFDTVTIGGGAPISRSVDIELADFDQDGRLDVAVLINDTGFAPPPMAEKLGALVLLFQGADVRNSYQWTRVVVSFKGTNDEGFVDMTVGDFDGQNGPDVVFSSNEPTEENVPDKFLYLYTNPGGGAARNSASWVETQIEQEKSPLNRVETIDVDQDGDLDVVATSPPAKSFNTRWMQNPLVESGVAAVTAGAWNLRMVGQQQDGGDVLDVGDIDGDGALDVAVARQDLRVIQWFRNPGVDALSQETFPIPWSVFNIGQLTDGDINQIQLVDMDGNGTLDCFVTASGNIAGYQRQLLASVTDFWTPFSILATEPVADIGKAAFGDFNGDGRVDFVAPLNREGLTQDQLVIFTRR